MVLSESEHHFKPCSRSLTKAAQLEMVGYRYIKRPDIVAAVMTPLLLLSIFLSGYQARVDRDVTLTLLPLRIQ